MVLHPQVGPEPTTIICPTCRTTVLTKIDYESTAQTHICAGIICLLGYVLHVLIFLTTPLQIFFFFFFFLDSGCACVCHILSIHVETETTIVQIVVHILELITAEFEL